MFVVNLSEGEPIYLPQPDDLLVNLSDSYDIVMNLLENLPNYHKNTKFVENAFQDCLKAANMILKNLGGKLMIF